MTVPLHPAIVHVPVALAVVVPLVAAGVLLAVWRGWLDRRAWAIVVALQLAGFAGALLALRTGLGEGERFEKIAEAAIERHEEAAEAFTVAAGVTLALAAGALVFRPARALRMLAAATVAAGVTAGALAVRAGHAGGELVFVHHLGGDGAPVADQRQSDDD